MNSLAKNMQILRFYPLLFDVNLGFIESDWSCVIKKRGTAPCRLDFRHPNVLPLSTLCRITTIMRQDVSRIFALFELLKEFDLIYFEYSNERRSTHETFKWPMFRI